MTTTDKSRALLAADTDRTQDYVFESARLPEIRGASTILLELNENDAPDLIKEIDDTAKPIFVGGGGLLYEVAADKAEAIQQALEVLYPQETGVATITCVHRELPSPADQGVPQSPIDDAMLGGLTDFQRQRLEHADRDLGCFGAWVRLLGHNLRRRKRQKRYVPFVEAPPHAERCQSCRVRPAATIYSYYGDVVPRCAECAKKNQASLRSPWRDEFDEKLRRWHPQLAKQYFAKAEQGTIPLDVGVIASVCEPRNLNKRDYVAFIYADGDGVGSFVESRRTRDDYQEISKDLREAIWYAVTFALAKNLAIQTLDNPMSSDETEEQRRRPTQPFEIITVGGDDVMVIVPAHVALKVARDMAKKFTEYLEKKEIKGADRPLTLSSGVVIAPSHMPVRLMRDFARELLKKGAKPRAKETKFAAVDFQVFTSTAIYGTDIMSLRNEPPYAIAPLGAPEKAKPLRLYHRPYTVPELKKLLDALDELNKEDFPTSQLYPLAEALERGRRRATLFYLYQRSRLDHKLRRALEQVEAVIEPEAKRDPLPWYKADTEANYAFSTTLRDVAELYDFVPKPQSEEVTA
jgi:hypothetical protein